MGRAYFQSLPPPPWGSFIEQDSTVMEVWTETLQERGVSVLSFPPLLFFCHLTLLFLFTQPMSHALEKCVTGWSGSTGRCEERDGTYCALYCRFRGEKGWTMEEAGNGGGGGACCASGSTTPAVVCHTEHRDSFSPSISLFQCFSSYTSSLLLLFLAACHSEPFE